MPKSSMSLMILTPLEHLLESGLKEELGISSGRRIYAEEVVTGSMVDDEVGRESIDSHKERMEHIKFFPERVIKRITRQGLTEFQKQAYEGKEKVPFFKRTSEWYNGLRVEYTVHAVEAEKREFYAPHADRIIKEGKISSEYVDISAESASSFIAFDINSNLLRPNTISLDLYDKNLIKVFGNETATTISNFLKKIHGQKYEPQKVYNAVMAILRTDKDYT